MPLIEKLKSLTPTEGEWVNNQYGHIYCGRVFIGEILSGDDCELTTLAPQMRLELIRMDEEIKRLKAQIEKDYKGYKFHCNPPKTNP